MCALKFGQFRRRWSSADPKERRFSTAPGVCPWEGKVCLQAPAALLRRAMEFAVCETESWPARRRADRPADTPHGGWKPPLLGSGHARQLQIGQTPGAHKRGPGRTDCFTRGWQPADDGASGALAVRRFRARHGGRAQGSSGYERCDSASPFDFRQRCSSIASLSGDALPQARAVSECLAEGQNSCASSFKLNS